jgi:hypothetical protein
MPTPDSYISPGLVEILPGHSISLSRANSILDHYRRSIVPCFPFVPIGDEVTAEELLNEKPVLFRTIVQIISPREETQIGFGQRFRTAVAQELVVKQQPSLEYLQAILLLVAG